jgi:hypothetical protein
MRGRGAAAVKRISHDALVKVSSAKPAGYLDEVLSLADRVEDGWVYIEDDTFYALRHKYSPDAYPLGGPGTELHRILARFGFSFSKQCRCRARMLTMNRWGCDGCEEHLEDIVGWLREEAAARKLPYLDVAGKMLVRLAISNARREAKRAKSTA